MHIHYFTDSLLWFLFIAAFTSIYFCTELIVKQQSPPQYSYRHRSSLLSVRKLGGAWSCSSMVLSHLQYALNTNIVEGNADECAATASCSATSTPDTTTSDTVTSTSSSDTATATPSLPQHEDEDNDDDDEIEATPNANAKSTIVEGVELPGMRLIDGVNLYRNGHGMRFIPFFGMSIKIYVAAMYSAKPILSVEQAMGTAMGTEGPQQQQQQQSQSQSGEYGKNGSSSTIIDASITTTTTTTNSNSNSNPNNHYDNNNNNNSNGPLQLDFTFLRYVGKGRVVSAWTQQLDHSVTHRDYEGYENDRARFIELASTGPIENQGMQSVQLVGDETRIIDQGKLQGVIAGKNFQRSFLSMWFGSMAVCEELKSNLLRADAHHPTAIRQVRQVQRQQQQLQLQQEEQQQPQQVPIEA